MIDASFYTLSAGVILENQIRVCRSPTRLDGPGWSVVRRGPFTLAFRQRPALKEASPPTPWTRNVIRFSLN